MQLRHPVSTGAPRIGYQSLLHGGLGELSAFAGMMSERCFRCWVPAISDWKEMLRLQNSRGKAAPELGCPRFAAGIP